MCIRDRLLWFGGEARTGFHKRYAKIEKTIVSNYLMLAPCKIQTYVSSYWWNHHIMIFFFSTSNATGKRVVQTWTFLKHDSTGYCVKIGKSRLPENEPHTSRNNHTCVNWQFHLSATEQCTHDLGWPAPLDLRLRQPKAIEAGATVSICWRGGTDVYCIESQVIFLHRACEVWARFWCLPRPTLIKR